MRIDWSGETRLDQSCMRCPRSELQGTISRSGASSAPPTNATGQSRLGCDNADLEQISSPTMHASSAKAALAAILTFDVHCRDASFSEGTYGFCAGRSYSPIRALFSQKGSPLNSSTLL